VEFFTAILTVPVLLTVIILNVSNLKKSDSTPTPTPEPQKIIVTIPEQKQASGINTDANPTPTSEACNTDIGPVSISSPDEGDVVTNNPVTITVSRQGTGYCAIVWSYRINGGAWSDYDDKSIALYNPPKGQITFELRVKSVVTGDEQKLTRKFSYDGSSDTTATPSGTVSN
jgi:hypothetical protein